MRPTIQYHKGLGSCVAKNLAAERIVISRYWASPIITTTYHSSSSTLKVLAFENMLSYAPILVRIVSTGQILYIAKCQPHSSLKHLAYTNRADFAGTNMPSCAIICNIPVTRTTSCKEKGNILCQRRSFASPVVTKISSDHYRIQLMATYC